MALIIAMPCIAKQAPTKVAPPPDARIEQWIYLLQENPVPELPSRSELVQAARREGFVAPAGHAAQRRKLLARVFPHLAFPDSTVEQMVLAEEYIHFRCPEEREQAQGKAWVRYATLAREVPDTLLPTWESYGSFLQASELKAMPVCRARLVVKFSPGAFREECSDPPSSGASVSGAETVSGVAEAPSWSPGCLQIRDTPPGTCLILARDRKSCQLKVEEFNSMAGDFRIPAQGTLTEGRADLLHAILGQNFQQPRVEAPGLVLTKSDKLGLAKYPGTPVRFLASSDSSGLDAVGGLPWLNLHLEDLPAELILLRDSIGLLASPTQRSTRYGFFRIDFGKGTARLSRSGEALLRSIEALAQTLDQKPAFLERAARFFYKNWEPLYWHPDTLAYSLWLSPSPDLDTASHRSVRVRSTGILNVLDSLAWKFSAGKRTDTLLGPFATVYGTALMRLEGKTRGIGKIPFDSAQARIRMHMARSMVLGSALGLLRNSILSEAETPRNAILDIPLPRFKDKAELAREVARLKYGSVAEGSPQLASLERLSERMLQDIYRVHKQVKDMGEWMDGLRASPEAERLGIRF